MAIYILQPMIDRVLGSRGGVTFQRCGQQFSIRNRAKPVLKRTEASQAVRAQFGSIQSRWRSLSGGDQTTFEDATPNYLRVNSLGNPYEIKAINLFSSANNNLVNQGLAQIDTIPLNPQVPGFTFTLSNWAGTFPFGWFSACSVSPVPAAFGYRIFAGPTQTSQTIPSKSNLRFIYQAGSSSSQFADLVTPYLNQFPDDPLISDTYIPAIIEIIDELSGQVVASLPIASIVS